VVIRLAPRNNPAIPPKDTGKKCFEELHDE
jgi:hypothetical protein